MRGIRASKRAALRSASSFGVTPSLSAARRDRLAVLVGAREEEHVLPALAVVAGEDVRPDRRVRVAQVRRRVDVVDRGRDEKLIGAEASGASERPRPRSPPSRSRPCAGEASPRAARGRRPRGDADARGEDRHPGLCCRARRRRAAQRRPAPCARPRRPAAVKIAAHEATVSGFEAVAPSAVANALRGVPPPPRPRRRAGRERADQRARRRGRPAPRRRQPEAHPQRLDLEQPGRARGPAGGVQRVDHRDARADRQARSRRRCAASSGSRTATAARAGRRRRTEAEADEEHAHGELPYRRRPRPPSGARRSQPLRGARAGRARQQQRQPGPGRPRREEVDSHPAARRACGTRGARRRRGARRGAARAAPATARARSEAGARASRPAPGLVRGGRRRAAGGAARGAAARVDVAEAVARRRTPRCRPSWPRTRAAVPIGAPGGRRGAGLDGGVAQRQVGRRSKRRSGS